jgi:signal transduction histidine kinase
LKIDTQSIVAVDKDGTYLTAPRVEVVGKNFFSEEIQQITNHNQQVFRLYERSVKLGEANDSLFDTGSGERFASAQPVCDRGPGQIMTVALSTATDSIYSQVDTALAAQNLQSIILLAAMAAAIGAFVAFLLKWNSALESTVHIRTLELQKSNEQLKAHDKLQQDFINVAAHELRTPIQPMLGIAEMMSSGLDGKDKVEVSREDIEMLERNANRLERLSSQLLEMARIEGNSMQLDLVQVDITTKIRNVIANAHSTLQKNIEIKYTEPDEPLAVRADRTKLFEVISNLLNNAIKFTQHGSITISAQPSSDGSEVIIRVADTGSGIHPEILPRLFTKFATKSESGTGIGLYISKRIIEAHGGKIWAQNNKSGIGTTFTFTLPRATV